MPLLLDLQVLVQAVFYLLSVVCSLVVSIPLGVTVMNFHGQCLLYTETEWLDAKHMQSTFSSKANCNFPIYMSVGGGIIYAAGMFAYYVYALTRKDPDIGSRMWILPFTVLNVAVTVSSFIAACIVSVGLKTFCDGFMKGREKNPAVKSCTDGERIKWHNKDDKSETYDGSTFYEFLNASQIAAWVLFLIWATQLALCCLRIVRNRRLHSQASGASRKGDDLKNVAAGEPTA